MAEQPLLLTLKNGWANRGFVIPKNLRLDDDKAYIMSLLTVLLSSDASAAHAVKELGGTFSENGYSIPQLQITRKEGKR